MSVKFDLTKVLKRSAHLQYFRKYDQYYTFHNLYGYIIGMSRDLVTFLDFYLTPRSYRAVLTHFEETYVDSQMLEFVDVFSGHGCLVGPDADETAPLWEMIPMRAAWIVYIIEQPDRVAHYTSTADGELRKETLSRQESALWQAINGESTLRELVDQLREAGTIDSDDALILEWVAHWTHVDRQLLKFSARPESYYRRQPHLRPPYLTSTMPYAPFDPQRDSDTDGVSNTREEMDRYHQKTITNPQRQFDIQETTLSHVLRRPHPALGDQSYGHRMVELLVEAGHLGPETTSIWEVGGGTGAFAECVLTALRDHYPQIFGGLTYTILDLAPALQQGQQARLTAFGERVRFVTGNAESYDFPESSIDLVLANEMLGDLTTRLFTREQVGLPIPQGGIPESPEEAAEAMPSEAERVARLEALGPDGVLLLQLDLLLADAPPVFYLNIGAYRLMQRLLPALKAGCTAVLVEFGEMHKYPVLSSQLDHPEFSIHFAHLAQAAERIGFAVDYKPIVDWMFVKRDLPALATTQTYFRTLAAALAEYGITMEKIGYSQQMLRELLGDALTLNQVHVLDFRPIAERCMGLVPHDFKALVLTKPGAETMQ